MAVKRDSVNILQQAFGYEPSTPLALVGTAIFALIGLGLLARIALRGFRDLRWGWCLPLGTFAYMAGFILRIPVKHNPTSEGLFILMEILLITSPATFLAFNYIIYARYVRNRVGVEYSPINPRRIAVMFVTSDITTFLIQGGGGGLQASSKTSTAKLGTTVVLVGLVAQLISYSFYIFLVVFLHRRILKRAPAIREESSFTVIWLIYFSSVFIVIRGVYRTIEFAQGHNGFLIHHEVYFYVLDALPLLLAICIYVPMWPGKYVDEREKDVSTDSFAMQSRQRV